MWTACGTPGYTNKDPNGNLAVAALPVYAVWTAPQWAPWLIGGTAALISSLYLADQFPDPSTSKAGTLQSSRPYEHMSYPSPQNPNDLKPPRGDAPNWQKWLYGGLGFGAVGYEIYDQYKKHEEGIKNFLNPNSQSNPAGQSFGGGNVTIQQRQSAAQSYNFSVGASTGGGGGSPSNNSLWVTPSGAVVTWGGGLVAGPVSK